MPKHYARQRFNLNVFQGCKLCPGEIVNLFLGKIDIVSLSFAPNNEN